MERSSKKQKISSSVETGAPAAPIILLPVEMISCYNSERIHFDGIKLSGSEPPMKSFMESERIFPSIMLENVTLANDHNLFWEKSGKNFTELIIKKCSISASDFILILKNLKNLTKLIILESQNFCKSLFIDIEKENKDLFVSSSKLTSFIIDGSWRGLGSVVFSKWLSKMPKITEFEILMVNEDLFIVDCLKKWEKQLTSLRLKNKICVETRNKIYQLNISTLEVFQIGSVETGSEGPGRDNGKSLIEFVSKQPNLLEFGVGICEVSVNFLVRLSGVVPNLKMLGIYCTTDLEDISSSEVLTLFGKVTKLHLTVYCFNALNNFLGSSNTNLTHLTYHIPIEDDEMRDIRRNYDIPFYDIKRFKNLTYFDVHDEYICNDDIQNILKLLTGLEVLKVKSNYTLSDFAFSGKGSQYPTQEKYSKYSVKGHSTGPFYQIGRLKNLIELDIQSTENKFTDLALDRIAKLKNLRILNLTNYKKITITEVAQVIASCQKLEQITITGCKPKIANEIASHFKNRVIKVIYENV